MLQPSALPGQGATTPRGRVYLSEGKKIEYDTKQRDDRRLRGLWVIVPVLAIIMKDSRGCGSCESDDDLWLCGIEVG